MKPRGKVNVRLVVEEKKTQQQYRLAEARRLDNIAKELAVDKKAYRSLDRGLASGKEGRQPWREYSGQPGGRHVRGSEKYCLEIRCILFGIPLLFQESEPGASGAF